MIREQCGTLAGALAHAGAGEPQCGWCARGEALAALEAEAFPRRPSPPADARLEAVSAEQAEANAAAAVAEADACERGYLRAIRGGAA
jgi:hypothetical protein